MEVKTLLHRQGGRCFYCRKELTITKASIEHVMPVSMNGGEGFNNLVACCKSMNSYLQGISPKYKIEILLNWWGKSPCPEDIESSDLSDEQTCQVMATNFEDPHYIPKNMADLGRTDVDVMVPYKFGVHRDDED